MASASGKSTERDIADIEEIVRKWAWQSFDFTKSKDQARIPKEFLHMSINWKHVKFDCEHPDYQMVPLLGNDISKKQQAQPHVLFKTVFVNKTNQDQEYSFQTHRATRSSATVIVEKGFTVGMEFNLRLKTPCEIVEANAGFKHEISVCNNGEETIEEELTWGVDSQVKVPPNTETTAELVITEAQCSGAFTMLIKFQGRVVVSFTNMRENNCLVTVIEGEMGEIILREIEKGLKGFRVERNRLVIAETRGKCNFKFGIEQHVKITERSCGGSTDGKMGYLNNSES